LGNQGRADDQKGCLRAAFFRADALKINVIFQSLFNNWRALQLMLWSRSSTFLGKTSVTTFSSLASRWDAALALGFALFWCVATNAGCE
jgi:hypothetical protein